MDNFSNLELFRLLSVSLQITNEKMKTAYEKFIAEVEALSQSETDNEIIFRTLNITRIEFKTLQIQILREQGKKCA